MSLYDLHNHFWQLHAEQSFQPSDSHLYFYLLHQFNAARWPVLLYRKRNQVAADSGLDVKTVDKARARLEARGLVIYDPGDQAKSATWRLGNAADLEGKNSLPAENAPPLEGKNSPPTGEELPKASQLEGKNSLPYKEEEKIKEEEKTHPKKTGAGELEISSSSQSQKLDTAPNPVAPPPSPAAAPAVGSVNPCLVPGTEASRALATEMAATWHITEGKNPRRWGQFATFTRTLAAAGRLEELRLQFDAYNRYRQLRNLRPYGIEKYLGHELEGYADGEWCGCEWADVLAEAQQQAAVKARGPNGVPETPKRANFSIKKKTDWS